MFRNGLEPVHVLILLILLVLLFGAKRLPDMAKSVGQSMKIFKNEVKDLREDTTTPSAPPADPTPTDKV
jgi:sec-independent protein translocase protein TatA